VTGPLLTREVCEALERGVREISLDLGRTTSRVEIDADGWRVEARRYPFIEKARDRTIYWWDGAAFQPAQRYAGALYKLVPTERGAPTFEIDGIKMLPTARLSPWEDARRKVALVRPGGKAILDCCGGLGYFAAWCLDGGARRVLSFEKSDAVLWLRELNPWSPAAGGALELRHGDVAQEIRALPDASFDAVLHDPPRFGTAGELYSAEFYGQLARVLKRRGLLFHYTGSPNKLTGGRNVPAEVARRLRSAGFDACPEGDGVLATRK
jgi:predicted methyltransferase